MRDLLTRVRSECERQACSPCGDDYPLTLKIEGDRLRATLENPSDGPLRIWAQNSSWGWETFVLIISTHEVDGQFSWGHRHRPRRPSGLRGIAGRARVGQFEQDRAPEGHRRSCARGAAHPAVRRGRRAGCLHRTDRQPATAFAPTAPLAVSITRNGGSLMEIRAKVIVHKPSTRAR